MLNRGLIPSHFLETEYKRSLQAYVYDYLKEEIMAEGLARNVPAFSRFLDAVAYSHGEIINHSNIARDSGVDSKTVREYFSILEDTLLGYTVEPFAKTRGRDVILKAHPLLENQIRDRGRFHPGRRGNRDRIEKRIPGRKRGSAGFGSLPHGDEGQGRHPGL